MLRSKTSDLQLEEEVHPEIVPSSKSNKII